MKPVLCAVLPFAIAWLTHAACHGAATAEKFSTRAVRVIVTTSPGGGADNRALDAAGENRGDTQTIDAAAGKRVATCRRCGPAPNAGESPA
jgi:tripartite-type tricarboxylate transporter receptor subunit TctC